MRPAILFTVDNVRQAYGELKQRGVEFLAEPFEIVTGLCVEFNDPFGNKFALTDYTKLPQLRGRAVFHAKAKNVSRKVDAKARSLPAGRESLSFLARLCAELIAIRR